MSWPAVTSWRAVCPMTNATSREAVGGLVALDDVLGREVVRLDLRPERDVLGRDDDRDLAQGRIRALAGWLRLPIVKTTRTNAMMARKIPMSRTNRFERFK